MAHTGGKNFLPHLVPKLHAAARKQIWRYGIEAMKPQYIETPNGRHRKGYWQGPKVTKRVASDIRKDSIRNGTYGSFNYETLEGWDRAWDLELLKAKSRGQGRMRITVPKLKKAHRTREERAQKIERALEGMDERISQLWEDRIKSKPPDTIENRYKKALRKR